MYSNCEHKLGAEKNKKIYCSLSSRVAKAHDNTHCYCYNNQKKKKKNEHEFIQICALKCNSIFLSVQVKG